MARVKPVRFVHKVIDPHPAGTMNDVTLVFDVNGDGFNDVAIGGLKGDDNLVWYEWPTWKRHVIGNTGRPSIVGKPYMPHNQVDLWENVTE